MKKFFSFIGFFFFLCHLEGLCVKDFFLQSEIGDYMVTSHQNKTFSVLFIRDKSPEFFLIEEVFSPSEQKSWKNWVLDGAPGNTSWTLLKMDMKMGKILWYYSFSKHAFLNAAKETVFLPQILCLPLDSVPKEKKKKIGPPPLSDEIDLRLVWNPPLTIEGKSEKNPQFEVFESVYPKDTSPLSGKTLVFYFAKDKKIFFPIWIQIEAPHKTFSLQVVDAGKNLFSPKPLPLFIGS